MSSKEVRRREDKVDREHRENAKVGEEEEQEKAGTRDQRGYRQVLTNTRGVWEAWGRQCV